MFLNFLYLLILGVVSPWITYRAIVKGRYREGVREKLLGSVPRRDGDSPCVWLHAVSVGEIRVIQSLIDDLVLQRPELQVVISTTTHTGMQLARKLFKNHTLFYCPLDFTWSVRRALRRLRPDLLLLTELELWPNLIHQAKQSGCNVAIINGRLSRSSMSGYRRIRPLIQRALRSIDWIGVQDTTYRTRFIELGAAPHQVAVTGSLKFDGAESNPHHPGVTHLRRILGLAETGVRETVKRQESLEQKPMVWVAGSTQDPEEKTAIETFLAVRARYPNLKLIVAPRHPERFEIVADFIRKSGLTGKRLSETRKISADKPSVNSSSDWDILLVDTIGDLPFVWGLADLAFVGGSFGKRNGQNMIEPAAFGASISFGPRTGNFRDVVRLLLDQQAAVVLDEPSDMAAWVEKLISNPAFRKKTGNAAKSVVLQHRGATNRTAQKVLQLLPDPAQRKQRAA